MTSAHIFKFESSTISEDDLKLDEDVWNDKNSNDFLRYIKHDYFMFVYICTHFINNVNYGFNHYTLLDDMGERNKSLRNCLLILALIRLNQLLHYVYEMHYDSNKKEADKEKSLYKYGNRLLMFLSFVGKVIVLYIFFTHKEFDGENLFCIQWIKVEIIAFFCEGPYFYYQKY